MASISLVESAKLSQDEFVTGIIESVIETNQMFAVLPFDEIEGNALAYNRETTLGDVQFAGVGSTITAKNPATVTQVTSSLTTIIGDAEMNGLIEATRSNLNDQMGVQIASKAKSAGRQFQQTMVVGTGASDTFPGLATLVAAAQLYGAGAAASGTQAGTANGAALNFEDLDLLLDLIKDKEGKADFLVAHSRTLRQLRKLMRTGGGNTALDLVTLPDGSNVLSYNGVPFFKNDWIPINQTKGTATNATTIYAGTLDDGSRTHGIAGLTAKGAAGIRVKSVGESETKDERIERVVWYCGMACFSELGLAALDGVIPG